MYTGTLVHITGPRHWYYRHESQEKILTLASKQIRELGGSLRQEVDFHSGSFVFTDGAEAVGLLVISEEEPGE
jgi:hypothetical protein